MIAETGYTRLKYLKGAAIHEYKKNMFIFCCHNQFYYSLIIRCVNN